MSTPVFVGKQLLKEFWIETKGKSKKLSIFHGNILEDDSDVMGISVYDGEDSKGEIFKGFQEQLEAKTNYTPERKLLTDGDKGWTGVSVPMDQQHHILYIHMASKEGDIIQSDRLRDILKMTFASISSYTYEGNEIRSVALPVLFRKGIERSDYENFIRLFIYESTKFLRRNSKVEFLHLYIWNPEDMSPWLKLLHKDLQLSIHKDVDIQAVAKLKQEIASKIMQPCYSSRLEDWFLRKAKNQLSKQTVDKWQLANIGNTLVNVIVEALSNLPKMPTELKKIGIFRRILEIKSKRLLVEWLADYLLSIKSYRTYSMDNTPTNLNEYQYLLMITQVLTYCEPLLQSEGSMEKGTDEVSARKHDLKM